MIKIILYKMKHFWIVLTARLLSDITYSLSRSETAICQHVSTWPGQMP